jgi:serine/threonine protein kinase
VEDHCQEVKTLLRLQEGPLATPCILHLYEFFWTYNRETGQGDLYLVTELLGQDLEQWRQAQQVTTERSVKQIAKVLLKAINYMASKGVVHRDIKLNNIMFRVDGDYRTLKIVDFGLAKVLVENETAKDFCGSLGYIAPEIYLSKPYRYEVDMFAFGIILFRLLSGQRPFPFTNAEKLRTDTINLSYSVKGQNWEGITADGLKLVRALLIGQEQRLTAVQAMNHRWFVAMEESVLNVDYMGTLNHVHEASENSRVVALVSFCHSACSFVRARF